jgi:hypothetical protein
MFNDNLQKLVRFNVFCFHIASIMLIWTIMNFHMCLKLLTDGIGIDSGTKKSILSVLFE